MIGYSFALLVAAALLNILGELFMRIRVTMRSNSLDRITWWRRGGDEIAAAYAELFPDSPLLAWRRFVFWLVVACAVVLLVAIAGRRR
jgi:hypothetical protein